MKRDNHTLPLGIAAELLIDNFAGGGGASTGIEMAFGRPVDVAINHDGEALAMHAANHPDTAHYEEDVFTVHPGFVTRQQPIGLAWFSPDCKHHSKAKGGNAGMNSKVRKDTGKSLPTASGPMFACLVDAAYLPWARAIDVRTIKDSQVEGGLGGYIKVKPSKTVKSSGKSVDILITAPIWDVIVRARTIKKEYTRHGKPLITPFLFPTRNGTPYSKSGLFSMWDRARDRLDIGKDSPPEERIQFRDLRALGATDAARAKMPMEEIQTRLAHTSSKTSEIYIKEAIPEVSDINLPLPWSTK